MPSRREDIVNMNISGNEGKDVRDTKVNSPLAREHKPHISAENKLGRFMPKGGKMGPLGARTGQG